MEEIDKIESTSVLNEMRNLLNSTSKRYVFSLYAYDNEIIAYVPLLCGHKNCFYMRRKGSILLSLVIISCLILYRFFTTQYFPPIFICERDLHDSNILPVHPVDNQIVAIKKNFSFFFEHF